MSAKFKVTYFLDVVSSWCFWAEPAWAELKRRYEGEAEFSWKITLIDPSGLPASQAQEEWFFRRSGTITRSPFMLKADWVDTSLKEYLAANCVAEAGRDFGVDDDRIRLAIMRAALLEGRKVGLWDVAAEIGGNAVSIPPEKLLARAKDESVEKRVRASTAEFHALQVTQRPTFVIESAIGDKAVFSGIWKVEPLIAVIDTMKADAAGYESFAAHFGAPPKS
jgi:predicted DsbA family dithiol-disulfide isomerase